MAQTFYCKFCGAKSTSVSGLMMGSCPRHPIGSNKGKHMLYEGDEKKQYTCKFCGAKSASIAGLTSGTCSRNSSGANKGKHEPAL